MADNALAFSRGFDSGNYAAAYETESLDEDSIDAGELPAEPYREGYMLGFFSSYELWEIPGEHRDEISALRAKHGED